MVAKRFRKDVLRPGFYAVPRRDAEGRILPREYTPFEVTMQDILQIRDNFQRMRANNLEVPAPWSHPPNGHPTGVPLSEDEARRGSHRLLAGWVTAMDVRGDGTLEAEFEIGNEQDAATIEQNGMFVSPSISSDYLDGKGRLYRGRSATHVALTQRPVNPDQSKDWEPVAMSQDAAMPICLSLGDALQLDFTMVHPRAPEGGVTIKGQFYEGGRWIPKTVLETASNEDLARLRDRQKESGQGDDIASAETESPEGSGGTAEESDAAKPVKDSAEVAMTESDNTGVKYPDDLYQKIKRERGKGGEVRLSRDEAKWVLDNGVMGCISAGRSPHDPEGMTDEQITERYQSLRGDLTEAGYKFIPAVGKYGEIEDSFFVAVPDSDRGDLVEMGRKYNQDSVILSEQGENNLIYTTGENAGKSHSGSKWTVREDGEDDFYTEIPLDDDRGGKFKFLLNINFDADPQEYKLSLEDLIARGFAPGFAETLIQLGNEVPNDDVEYRAVADEETPGGAVGDMQKLLSAFRECGIELPDDIKLSGDLDVLLAAVMNCRKKPDSEEGGNAMAGEREEKQGQQGMVQMSLDDLPQGLRDTLAKAVDLEFNAACQRVNALVSEGQITPAVAAMIMPKREQFQMSLDGVVSPPSNDLLMQALSALPKKTFVSDGQDVVLDNEEALSGGLLDPSAPLTPEQVNAEVDKLLNPSGKPARGPLVPLEAGQYPG